MRVSDLTKMVLTEAVLMTLSGCSDDPESTVSPFAGNYKVSQAKVAVDIVIPTVEAGSYTVPANTDITALIQEAIFKTVACSPLADTYIELRDDNSMYMSCKGANPVNAGTWTENSASSLALSFNATVLPPVGFNFSITDAVIDAAGFSGKTGVPFSSTVIAGLIAPLTLSPSAPALFVVNIAIKFTEQ
ncbi:MAG: hypothetical protein MUD02_11820 [Bacteroidales bacterium]|nr:hypothetical protein [Bacteroidales bacterium]